MGNLSPKRLWQSLTKYPDQPTATAMFPTAYSRADNCADTDTRQIKRSERAFHLPLRRRRFCDQMVRTFGSKQLKCHRARSCHQAVAPVNPKLSRSSGRELWDLCAVDAEKI